MFISLNSTYSELTRYLWVLCLKFSCKRSTALAHSSVTLDEECDLGALRVVAWVSVLCPQSGVRVCCHWPFPRLAGEEERHSPHFLVYNEYA